MIGIGCNLLFSRRSGNPGPPIPSFNPAMVDAWFMSGLSNADKPDSIKGHKGNVLQLKNFTYALNSGFGEYAVNWNSFAKTTANANFTNTDSSIHITEILVADGKFLQTSADGTIAACKVRVEGITDDIKLRYVSYAEDGTGTYTYLKNGINELPISYKKFTGFAASVVGKCNITITQLPTAYEGALVFDGVDDYGICESFPALTDYTVICRREFVKEGVLSKRNTNNTGAFLSEIYAGGTVDSCYSYGYNNTVSIDGSDSVVYVTPTSYNGQSITRGDWVDNNLLFVGASLMHAGKVMGFMSGAIYYFAIYNKSLTVEEIEEEKVKLNDYWEGGKL